MIVTIGHAPRPGHKVKNYPAFAVNALNLDTAADLFGISKKELLQRQVDPEPTLTRYAEANPNKVISKAGYRICNP